MPFSCQFSTAFSTAFAICEGGAPPYVPPQMARGTHGVVRRHRIYDHIDTVRPRSIMGGVLELRETIERTTRNEERELIEA